MSLSIVVMPHDFVAGSFIYHTRKHGHVNKKPYWLLGKDPLATYPKLDHDTSTDVVVIGGGITGASTSYWLSGRCRVLLLEQDVVASKASGRNAGFLLTGTSDHYNQAVARYGRRRARAVWQATRKNHELLQRHVFAEQECDHERCGSYLVAASGKEMDDIVESVDLLRRDGFNNNKLMERSETSSILSTTGSHHYHGAAFNAGDGAVDPVKLARALLGRAEGANGTKVFERSTVKHITAGKEGVRVEANGATVSSEFVVIAANAYAPRLNTYLRKKIRPVRGQMLATKPLRHRHRRLNGVFYANYGHEYWRQAPDGRMLAGGFRELDPRRETGYSMTTTRKIQRRLEGLLAGLAPGFGGVEQRWSGIMGFSEDLLPIVGPLPGAGRLLVSAGYSGHGLGFSFIAGKMISGMILGKGQERGAGLFSPSRSFAH